ncbi:hypothetical protein NEOLEDRAFT_1245840 [Neolentinus lepideus HHB14362 ss-1]|uniref:Uncharacterized protein n=1 Tax=Neolentinus lepideus HHB14362 ss-1 TaxID=1314782 RepID=A0A165NB47_9AGAM|nr:hypothetical protein NEOLEDRAFT_1245840 [Neolentinus lepideus HHB14362 ss-1]
MPFPSPFPYDIKPPEDHELTKDQMKRVERWLSDREANHEQPLAPSAVSASTGLRKFYSDYRDTNRELIGLAKTSIRDCLSCLHVGDVFSILGMPTLTHSLKDQDTPESSEEDMLVWMEFVDVLAGHVVLMSFESPLWAGHLPVRMGEPAGDSLTADKYKFATLVA